MSVLEGVERYPDHLTDGERALLHALRECWACASPIPLEHAQWKRCERCRHRGSSAMRVGPSLKLDEE